MILEPSIGIRVAIASTVTRILTCANQATMKLIEVVSMLTCGSWKIYKNQSHFALCILPISNHAHLRSAHGRRHSLHCASSMEGRISDEALAPHAMPFVLYSTCFQCNNWKNFKNCALSVCLWDVYQSFQQLLHSHTLVFSAKGLKALCEAILQVRLSVYGRNDVKDLNIQ